MESEGFEINLGNSFTGVRKSSQEDFIKFWGNEANSLTWFKHWDNTLNWNPPFA